MAERTQDHRPAVIADGHTIQSVTDKISAITLRGTSLGWLAGFAISFLLVLIFLVTVVLLLIYGVGIWGINIPVAWGIAIVNMVWWIGIGHAGTLISAVLLLFRQSWRTSINRFAEAMTLFALASASVFPLLHMGRPWFFYWMLPYPNTMDMWPQFRSPLVWDLFAITAYGLVSLLFWYIGLIPDMATLRDHAPRRLARFIYGVLAMGWRGSARHWRRYETVYFFIAALATPLVVSVHSIVSLDFAVSVLPGWHATIFPPYFVAGALFSGFAMVLMIAIPLRAVYRLHDFVTLRHLQNMAKIMLAAGLFVTYSYLMEIFIAWYGGSIYEDYIVRNRLLGPYAPLYWLLLVSNVLVPQLLWFARVRSNVAALFFVAMMVNLGMWLERFVIVVTTLHRSYLPSMWAFYLPTFWDWATFLGTIGLFLALLFLFIRFLPLISIFEMRGLLTESLEKEEGHAAPPAALRPPG